MAPLLVGSDGHPIKTPRLRGSGTQRGGTPTSCVLQTLLHLGGAVHHRGALAISVQAAAGPVPTAVPAQFPGRKSRTRADAAGSFHPAARPRLSVTLRLSSAGGAARRPHRGGLCVWKFFAR